MTGDFAQKYGPWAVIAGASEGVGASLADQLAERGLDLVLIARNGTHAGRGCGRRARAPWRRGTAGGAGPDRPRRLANAWPRRPTGSRSDWSSTTPAPRTARRSFSTTRSRTRCSRSSWRASARSRWPGISPRPCANAVAAASCSSGSLACLAGSSLLAVYSAVKAFNVNFAEGLWAELRPHGVDVCCTPLGMTYTEALQRMGYAYDPETRHAFRGCCTRDHRQHRQRPDIPCGRKKSRTMASMVWTADRRTLVELMSAASLDSADQAWGRGLMRAVVLRDGRLHVRETAYALRVWASF